MTALLAVRLTLLVVQVLLPRPTEPSQPTSKPAAKEEHDTPKAPMGDDELSSLAISLEDIDVEPPDATTKSVAQAQQVSDSGPTPVTPPSPGRASDRSVRDAFPPLRPKSSGACEPAGLPSDSALAPRLLAPRWELGAALLGGFVGFGTGHFYAAAPRRGVVMGITDTLLLGGLAGSLWALNEHVVQEDRRTGLSLARNQRDRDGTESKLYALSWGLGIAAGISRIFQAADAYRAAVHTNEELKTVTLVPHAMIAPRPGGGELALAWSW